MTANLVPIIDIHIETEIKNDVVFFRSKPPLTDKVTTVSAGKSVRIGLSGLVSVVRVGFPGYRKAEL
ncbi:hypothetical protein VC81_07435 [Levilactobacillus spicheri]|uniref:Uncharacterized protein n=1 Tax=Levilactobacillus spicheri TaxID=216463 RepID=A0A0F3RR41_9LACO|nr:hypothetical protein VC81_07435 [Levilactobacillus spicheri]